MRLEIKVFYNDSEPEEIVGGDFNFDQDMTEHYESLKAESPSEVSKWLNDHAEVFTERELIDIRWVLKDDEGAVIAKKESAQR